MNFEYVDFPAVGLRTTVTRTLFSVFGQDIYTYAVIIALSIILMILLGLRHSGRYGIEKDDIIDFMIFAMPASIICARIYYVIFSWDNYRANPIEALNIRSGGLAIYGAVIGAFATVLIFFRVRKKDPIRFLDFGVPYLLLAQGIGRWGNFVNQEVFGTNTTLPWGMTSNQIVSYLSSNAQRLSDMGIFVDPLKPVHPTFLYESLWNILVACILFGLRRRQKYKGEVLLGYLIGYGIGRAFIEGLRTDSLMLGSIRISQLLSVIIVAACLAILIFFRKKLPLYAGEPLAATAAEDVSKAEGDEAAESEAEAGDINKAEGDVIENENDESEAEAEAEYVNKAESDVIENDEYGDDKADENGINGNSDSESGGDDEKEPGDDGIAD